MTIIATSDRCHRRSLGIFRRYCLPWLAYALTSAGVAAAASQQAPVETVLHSFSYFPPPEGDVYAGVVRDPAGNLYGVSDGGTANQGTVLKLDTSGHLTVLHDFTGGADGGAPNAVILDSSGNLYGSTAFGGASNKGVVYSLNAAGQQTVLYNFTGGADGFTPGGAVALDSAGNLYGTTTFGGSPGGAGGVYRLDPSGHLTVLHSFTGGADGGYPYGGGVVLDSAGNLYGVTSLGGTYNGGVLYKINTAGQEAVLYNFEQAGQNAALILDPAGNLYGTEIATPNSVFGDVYRFDAAGHFKVLYRFTGGADGNYPSAGVIRDSAGNLYGTTSSGGSANAGTVYKLEKAGQLTVLFSFAGSNSGSPTAGVVRDPAGNLYGTTPAGGLFQAGQIFKLNTVGHETILYTFKGGRDGKFTYAGVIRDSAGNLYGTTPAGGVSTGGILYKLDNSGRETVLHTFGRPGYSPPPSAASPIGGVTMDSAGNLYGTTQAGGPKYSGTIYKFDTGGQFKLLYSFPPAGYPYAGVTLDAAGNLYGTTTDSCPSPPVPGAAGYVYKLDTAGQFTILYAFTGGADGGCPEAAVTLDAAGNLYGTTNYGGSAAGNAGWGVVYKVDPSGQETVLHTFTGGPDGGYPYAGVILDSAGNLYGATGYGGAGHGVVYKLDSTGNETVLYTFTGGADGGVPVACPILDAAGNLYGTTELGGAANAGVVYKLDPTAHETVLYTFTGGADGSGPMAGVTLGPDGNLYGTTYFGGTDNEGVVFKIKLP